jgi:hypothetical protein
LAGFDLTALFELGCGPQLDDRLRPLLHLRLRALGLGRTFGTRFLASLARLLVIGLRLRVVALRVVVVPAAVVLCERR